MIRHKHIDKLCALAMVLALALTGLLFFGEALGIRHSSLRTRRRRNTSPAP